LQQQPELQVRDHEGRGQDFTPKDALLRRLLQVARNQSIFAALFQRAMDAVQDFDQIRAGTAARIEDVDVFVRQALLYAQVRPQHAVHALDHVLDDFGRGVPDAQLLSQFRVKGFEKRLVEVLDGVRFLEFVEKRGPVDAVEHQSGAVEHFDKIQVLKLARVGDQREEPCDHRHAQEPGGKPPIEAFLEIGRVLLGPQHPGGKDSVENSKIKAAYYYKKTGKKYPILVQDDTMDLFGIDPTEDPGVSIKQPVLKEFGDFNDTNAYKYYGNLAAKYGGKIELQFNYGHALAFAEKVIALPSKLKGILVAEVSKQRTPGYFLADMVKVKINGEWRYYNSLSDREILLRDSDLAQSINSLLRRL